MRRTLNPTELANTRQKLSRLERLYKDHDRESGADAELRELSMESLMRLINQLKEEISWTESHQPARNA